MSTPCGERERALVDLAVALTLEDGEAVRRSVVEGKQVGLDNQDITRVVEMVIAFRSQRLATLGKGESCVPNDTERSTCCR